MKKIIVLLILCVPYSQVVKAVNSKGGAHSSVPEGKSSVKASEPAHYGQMSSEWNALKVYDVNHPINLGPFEMLKKENWSHYTLEKFKDIPEFHQAKSVAEVKKIVLKMLLARAVPRTVIANFLTTEEASTVWRAMLDDVIHSPQFAQLTDADLGPVIHNLMVIPLSVVDRKALVLPIPEAQQSSFAEYYNQHAAASKCLRDDHTPDKGGESAHHFSIDGSDETCFSHWVSALTEAYVASVSDEDTLKKIIAQASSDPWNQRILNAIEAETHKKDDQDNQNDNGSNGSVDPYDNRGNRSFDGSSSSSTPSAPAAPDYHFDGEYIGKTFEPENQEHSDEHPENVPHKTKNFLDQLKGRG